MQVFRGWKGSSLFLVFTTLPRTAFAARMSRVDVVDLAEDDDPNHDSPTSRVQEWVLGLGMSPPPSPPATTHSGSPPDPSGGSKRSSEGSEPSSGPGWPSPTRPWTGDQIPFVAPRVIAGRAVVHAPDVASLEPPSAEIYHNLRGMVCGGANVSELSPSQPPPARSDIEFQLPTEDNPYHVLAIKWAMRQDQDPSAPRSSRGREARPQFSITFDAMGYIYIGAVHQGDPSEKPEGFELITRYPAAVNEFSAQSVYKDGVLFVIAAPKESSVVEVPVLSVPKSSSGKSSNLRFQRD